MTMIVYDGYNATFLANGGGMRRNYRNDMEGLGFQYPVQRYTEASRSDRNL